MRQERLVLKERQVRLDILDILVTLGLEQLVIRVTPDILVELVTPVTPDHLVQQVHKEQVEHKEQQALLGSPAILDRLELVLLEQLVILVILEEQVILDSLAQVVHKEQLDLLVTQVEQATRVILVILDSFLQVHRNIVFHFGMEHHGR